MFVCHSRYFTIYNAKVDAVDRKGRTPLHYATCSKIVDILLNNGASLDAVDNEGSSAFRSLLKKDGKNALGALDHFIGTNGKDMDSSDLLVVYNLDFFKQNLDEKHDMSHHEDMVSCESDLLYHPLTVAMTTLKARNQRCKSTLRLLYGLLKIVFTLSLTMMIICEFGNKSDNLLNEQTPFEQVKNSTRNLTWCATCNIYKHPGKLSPTCSFTLNEDREARYMRLIDPSSVIDRCKFSSYAALASVLLFSSIEIAKAIRQPIYYFRQFKNWTVFSLIFSTFYYLAKDFESHANWKTSFSHFLGHKFIAATSIFLAWVNIILLLKHIPRVGLYIHMFVNVSKTLMYFILIYSPALLAFAFSFFILMPPETKAFKNAWMSIMKVMAMLVGELDYDETFMNNEDFSVDNRDATILVQIISVCFIWFCSIVLMNLLVGLTVSEIDLLRSKAWQISLKEKTLELVHDEKDCWGLCWLFTPRFSIFKTLEYNLDKKKNAEKYFSSKLCVKPKKDKRYFLGPALDKILHNLKEAPHVVHFLKRNFDKIDNSTKNTTNDSDATGFYFPKELVDRTIECLRAKEERRKQSDNLENFEILVDKVVSHHITTLTERLNGQHRI